MFAELKPKTMTPIPQQNKEIQALLRIIAAKCNQFAIQNADKQYGDLGAVKQDLININNFISDNYLNEVKR